MSRKKDITKDITYEGLGFPVLIQDVETKMFRGEELPVINHNKLNELVFIELLRSSYKLTGNQLNFIRGHLGLTQQQFAESLGYANHGSVGKWLSAANEATGMHSSTELAVRMLMADYLNRFQEVNENTRTILSDLKEPSEIVKVAA